MWLGNSTDQSEYVRDKQKFSVLYHNLWIRTFGSVMGILPTKVSSSSVFVHLVVNKNTANWFSFSFFVCFWLTTSMVWKVANIPLTFCFSGCSDCTFNLCTPTRPVILPGNEKLVLAPYHTYYPTLEEHLQGPWGIPIEPNLWNDPLVLGEKTFGDQCIKQSHNKRSVK